ncbi:MAG TPA: zinc ribbon domain-containing protein [Thermoplasmata archaeon]|nr:zinc ribbon domain-containing protein [Thermoplasmata archaeon]
MIGRLILLVTAVLLLGLSFGTASAHYAPKAGNQFNYEETIQLTNGTGTNYQGYTESQAINGSLWVAGIAPNGTVLTGYYSLDGYQNNQGASNSSTASGNFGFSPTTLLYVNGTDGQTGYTNPHVWFFMDNTLTDGATFYVFNTQMTVVSTSYSYDLGTAAGGYVTTIYSQGSGSYERNDAYGILSATFTWKMYFDPTTGYIVGYSYVEQDSNSTGNGFTWTDSLHATHTSYALTPGSAPPPSSGGSSNNDLLYAIVVVVIVVIVIVILALALSRRRPSLPRHSATGRVSYVPPPMGPPPPGIHLIPSGQPAVQQIVVKETVKVNCRYCGALIDTTAEKCPFCGAARN